ncbi:MAG: GNAT family N-acetyltransferase [Proteobacteria bacterium]|nr:GNAT family N-acetyltransferase [Pseudomonadota bacterium]
MNIIFAKLQEQHFLLLLKWLESPHVKQWWDQDIQYTKELIEKKYRPYTQGFKILSDIKKPMHAFIVEVDNQPVGYIQYYDKYDFPHEQGYSVEGLPKSLAAIDFYIGEESYLGHGIGTEILRCFLKEHVLVEFDACFVDPDTANKGAIRAYEKTGFTVVNKISELAATWMICNKDTY